MFLEYGFRTHQSFPLQKLQRLSNLPCGEVIFQQGDEGEEMFAVRKGQVGLKINGQLLTTIEEDETFGEMALIDRKTRSATAEALTDCEIVPIDSRRFLFMVQQTPNFALTMLQILAQRLRSMDATVK